ncbi:adenosylmethionine--8-amino-7-oxononanoate transaminase [Flavihumibacter profundi]|jgi:adenosylmethionine---8-amino-7-oxononanoate aminotransferase|uniref:adenosylmethionine--8-amino-7-oxononanoate transaminase n=1 Tax=Flavihumibacter profundi TaxID=2716883 RepID=UPI001CC7E298|nr:adenosylmethionine--8-amino-7-oxononanoate transaminase [Flavihumibacter profundi]MBZ5856492.1 adenosylmethionine--8-amino-7-oxononanoate transaminase [Flavihumibacter profundi]
MNWLEQDKNYIWHPFTPQKSAPDPVFIEKGKGSWLYDDKGNRYLDAISSWWVNLHGHAHPYIAEKLYQQALKLEHIIFAGFTHQPAIELAGRLLPLLPGNFSRIFYSDNGSTATEVALKMAIQFWWNNGKAERKKILAFKNSYHGDTFGAMSVSDRSVFTLAFHDLLFDVIFIDVPLVENIEKLQSIIQKEGKNIAAFIYEPLVQGAGGMKMYDAALLEEILILAKKQEIICIADEVMTGFGRTGKLFASDHLAQKPDIICLSKGLTGGTMALGVTACTAKIYSAYLDDDKKKTFFHGHSFTANPLACTAALASLDLLEKDALSGINRLCYWNGEFSKKLRDKFPDPFLKVQNIRQTGTILAFEINRGENVYLNQVGAEITRIAMEEEVYLRPLGNTVYFMPPICLTEEEYFKLADVTESILNKL